MISLSRTLLCGKIRRMASMLKGAQICSYWMGGVLCVLIFAHGEACAWQFRDLWVTRDKQALAMMQDKQFKAAEKTFENQKWAAFAAFRAKDYLHAKALYETMHDENAYYNLGNTLAYLGEYQQAMMAYDKALALNANHEDARFNRQLIADWLKQQQASQSSKNQSSQTQNQDAPQSSQQQDQSNHKAPQDNQNQSNQPQQMSPPHDAQSKNEQEKEAQAHDQAQDASPAQDAAQEHEDKLSSSSEAKEAHANRAENSEHMSQDPKQSSQDRPDKLSPQQQEAQDAAAQWMRLIPDDPGGLLREKFRRDYLKRQHGWGS